MSPEDTQYLVHKIALAYGAELISDHPWIFESAKWRELVFSILAQPAPIPQSDINDLALRMEALGLIDPEALAELQPSDSVAPSDCSPLEQRIIGILRETGYSEDVAKKKLRDICAMASLLRQSYAGRIQLYLRDAGERMLGDVLDMLEGEAADSEDLALGLTFWMQNVLNLPLSLRDTNVLRFCRENGLEMTELIDAADGLDLGVAFLDDLLHLYYAHRGEDVSNNEA